MLETCVVQPRVCCPCPYTPGFKDLVQRNTGKRPNDFLLITCWNNTWDIFRYIWLNKLCYKINFTCSFLLFFNVVSDIWCGLHCIFTAWQAALEVLIRDSITTQHSLFHCGLPVWVCPHCFPIHISQSYSCRCSGASDAKCFQSIYSMYFHLVATFLNKVKVLIAWACLFATPWTAACQPPLSMEFSKQED